MINAQASAQVKAMTDLTCWKCGEESLTEMPDAVPASPKGEPVMASATRHSTCGKCGAYSVNATQARHNRTVGRQNRKAIIKEANRTQG